MRHESREQIAFERDYYRRLLQLASYDEPRPLLSGALGLLTELTCAREGYIELYDDEDAQRVGWSAVVGCDEARARAIREAISRGIVAEAIATGEVVLTASAVEDPRFRELDGLERERDRPAPRRGALASLQPHQAPRPHAWGGVSRVSYEPVFYACNFGVLLPWSLLILAPRWKWTERIAMSAVIPLVFGAAYAVILFTDEQGSPDGSFLTLDGIEAIFTSRQTVAAAWIHYLIFDLFVGAWIVRDARRHAIAHLATVPLLILTLLFGPVGLIGYLLLRAALRRRWLLEEEAEAPEQAAAADQVRR